VKLLVWAALATGLAAPAAAQQTTRYEYDALGRLVAFRIEGGSTGGVVTTIGYDAASNRTAYSVSGAPPSPLPPPSQLPPTPPSPLPPSSAGRVFVVVPLSGFTLIPVS
jgi:hypothetical protein